MFIASKRLYGQYIGLYAVSSSGILCRVRVQCAGHGVRPCVVVVSALIPGLLSVRHYVNMVGAAPFPSRIQVGTGGAVSFCRQIPGFRQTAETSFPAL